MKKLAISLAIFGATFVMAQQTPRQMDSAKKQEMQAKRDAHLDMMKKDLNLTQTQVNQLKSIHEKYQAQRIQERQKMTQMRKQQMEAGKMQRQQMDDEMRKVLTPEQYQKWQLKKQENMQKMQNKNMQNRKMQMHKNMKHKMMHRDSMQMKQKM